MCDIFSEKLFAIVFTISMAVLGTAHFASGFDISNERLERFVNIGIVVLMAMFVGFFIFRGTMCDFS